MPRRSNKPILLKTVPFVGLNTVRGIGGQRALFIAVMEVGDGYLCIEYQLGISQVVLFAVKAANFPHFFAEVEDPLDGVVSELKSRALDNGATLEAIQLLGQLTPLTKEEETEMAKAPAAKAAEKLKTTAKTAPATKEKVGRTPVEFDYKVVKGAKNELREGTWGHHMIEVIMAHTSSAEARAANAKAKGATAKGEAFSDKSLDFKFAKDKGFITY